jgi:hypothetical protein
MAQILRQRIEYRAYVNPVEKEEYVNTLKSHGYIIVLDETAAIHDAPRHDGKPEGIRVEKMACAIFEEAEE